MISYFTTLKPYVKKGFTESMKEISKEYDGGINIIHT